MEMNHVNLFQGDCLHLMKNIPDRSIDMIFADLPYNTTQNSWDCLIPLEPLWFEYKRIIKERGIIALWGQAPFSHVLAASNLDMYRYEWIIEKTKGTGHLNAKKMPLKAHEQILIFSYLDEMNSLEQEDNEPYGTLEEQPETIQIFYKKLPTYNPQKTEGHAPVHSYTKHQTDGTNYGTTRPGISGGGSTSRYPRDVLRFSWDTQKLALHPTQKPLEACKYMIRTYTNPGDIVLDNCMGSGTTGVACVQLERRFIGIEKDEYHFKAAQQRILTATE